jgi:UDP-arabinose 4-epimerase
MRVLVTGGAGYIGSHTCKALAEAGHTPVVFDNLRTGHRWAVQWGPLEVGDVNDAGRLDEVMRRHKPEAVVHFAGVGYVGESFAKPDLYYRTNVAGTLTLLEAMRAHDVGAIVFSSSCATYGVPERVPITETTPQAPINPYGNSKKMAEELLRDFSAGFGMTAVALRYFNAAGADAAGVLGEEHEPEQHLIPLILQAAAGQRPEIAIYGDDYDTPDGTCVRDYVHVSDLASAHVSALTNAGAAKTFQAFNLGTGKGASVAEVVALARRISGKDFIARVSPRRPGDPAVLYADPARANDVLKWQPRAELATMIEDAWRWMTEHRHKAMRQP